MFTSIAFIEKVELESSFLINSILNPLEDCFCKMKNKFDKYWYYRRSVQSPDWEVRFIEKCYKRLKGKNAYVFREDFCFTFALSCEWVKLGKQHQSVSIDIDDRPLKYGKENYLSQLTVDQQKRIKVVHSDVLARGLFKADIISALNFSYFVFKKREQLKKYFRNCFKSLNPTGLFVLDCFGGSQCFESNEEQINYRDFIYYWDQKNFDPISHQAMFYIHYKRKGEKKRERVFTYDWRLWMIPEIKEILQEVGFRKTHVYWEGTDKQGEGNGIFTRRKTGEDCESWVAYIVSEK